MLLILCLVFVDSVLPLPDLTEMIFPEPKLWIPDAANRLFLEAYGFVRHGGIFDLRAGLFDLRAEYDHNIDWDTTSFASLSLAQYAMKPRYWVKPSIQARYFDRRRSYFNWQAGCEFNYYLPWSAPSILVRTDNWSINGVHYQQTQTDFTIVFDRLRFPYCVGFSGCFNDDSHGFGFSNIRIGSFFIELSSPLPSDFPSPRMKIQYLEPGLIISQMIESGVFPQSFDNYLDMSSPAYFAYPAPSESLHIRLTSFGRFGILGQTLIIKNTFAYWQFYPTLNRHFRRVSIPETRSNNLTINLVNTLTSTKCSIRNSIGVGYHWHDSTAVFQPRFSIDDTLEMELFNLSAELTARYIPHRPGFEKRLAPWFVASTRIGFRLEFAQIFLRVDNLGGFQEEVFDDIVYQPRRYSAGLRFAFNL